MMLYRHFDKHCVIKSLGQNIYTQTNTPYPGLFRVNVYVVADSVGAFPVLPDNDFCMVDNAAAF